MFVRKMTWNIFCFMILWSSENKNIKTIGIPMLPTLRYLNLSNLVAIITYEILRQYNFEELQGVSTHLDK